MRHFRDEQRARGRVVHYVELEDEGNTRTLGGELARMVTELRPTKVIVTEPGEWRVAQALEAMMKDDEE